MNGILSKSELYISKHFFDRIRERMLHDGHLTNGEIIDCVLDARDFGLRMQEVLNRKYKQYLMGIYKKYGHDMEIRILDGYVYVFNATMSEAITFYPVEYYATYERNYTC